MTTPSPQPTPAQYRQLRERVGIHLRWLSLLRPKVHAFMPPDTAKRAAKAYDFCRRLLDRLHACGVDDEPMLRATRLAVEATANLVERQTAETVEAAWSALHAVHIHVHYASCASGVGVDSRG
jgi:hypothetical protein